MACLAGRRETSGGMVRVRRVLVVSLVAAVARGWQGRVVVVDVATRAWRSRVRSG